MPDHPAILQTYVRQDYDLASVFPELKYFLDFWQRELDGPLPTSASSAQPNAGW